MSANFGAACLSSASSVTKSESWVAKASSDDWGRSSNERP
jgi:hypothetical protein